MVKILHIYYDIMNLYGENGNVRILERRLLDMGAEVEVTRKTITDDIDFCKYDFIYCGSSIESNRDACLEHLYKYKESLIKAYNENKVMLFTGNSYEMLGKTLINPEGKKLLGIGLFDFNVVEQRKNRYSGDIVAKAEGFENLFVGFINKCSEVLDAGQPFLVFKNVIGTVKEKCDGIHSKNFYGTQLIGPILVRNPHFAEHIAKLLFKGGKEVKYDYCERGYEITLSELTKER